MLPAGDQAMAHRVHHLADDPDLVGLEHERIERRVHRSLDRVLDRHDRALRAFRPRRPSRSRRSSAAERARVKRSWDWSSEAIRASSLNVPSGPRKATRTCAATRRLPGRRLPAWKPPAAAPAGLTERASDRLVLLGRQLDLRGPVAHALHVQASLVAVQDRGQHDPGALLVQQRHRAGLTPAHLVVGVVADHRGAADATSDPGLVGLEPRSDLLEGRLDQLAELHERDLDALGMGDQVALAAGAEHDGLRSAQLPELCEAEPRPRAARQSPPLRRPALRCRRPM